MGNCRTHLVLPERLLKDIDLLVGKRGRSSFFAVIAEREVKRRKLLDILGRKDPIWSSENHPELRNGAAAWVSKMRRTDERIRQARQR
jgi:predicted CopG family antitoxin